MLTQHVREEFEICVRLVSRGVFNHSELAHWVVYNSGDLCGCQEILGEYQLSYGASDKGLRLLDLQLEVEKLLASPEMIEYEEPIFVLD